ncbi:unnamed protein product [Clonostachys rosea]|uniref:Uncharacterized protein n=1 Tax=Bionectria ochroleuca TaxID=29856 RepID=A0ABY6UV88_BIOOC|nr:unnamed protein product [Clonostachys rosea]
MPFLQASEQCMASKSWWSEYSSKDTFPHLGSKTRHPHHDLCKAGRTPAQSKEIPLSLRLVGFHCFKKTGYGIPPVNKISQVFDAVRYKALLGEYAYLSLDPGGKRKYPNPNTCFKQVMRSLEMRTLVAKHGLGLLVYSQLRL